jgi:CRISPR system Cascade subunit CasA
MNLITDPWIPVIRRNGPDKIKPWQIAETDNPVMELNAPRPDFQGALYQFLIGLVQTCFAPEDEDEWLTLWERMPSRDELRAAFEKVEDSFDLEFSKGTGFMQDHDDFEGDWLPIEDLIGGALSDNTRKGNKDLFVKSGQIKLVSPYWAALALFNLQVTGVLAWGKHRIGLRGNAPLTTLLVPDGDQNSLWQKLWLNVIYREDRDLVRGDLTKKNRSDIFPWMGKTRISPNKEPTSPSDAHPLQHYWAMPRRIRLKIEPVAGEICDLSGLELEHGVKFYKRIHNGVYYTNGWVHPLTPYTREPKNKFPKPIEGKYAGEGFRQWVSLNYDEFIEELGKSRALVVRHYYEKKPRISNTKLWCFGYDADSANVKCWYESIMPTFRVPMANIETLKAHTTDILELAYTIVEELRLSLIRAWFKPQKDSNGKEKWNHILTSIKNQKTAHLSTYKKIEYDYWDYLQKVFPDILESMLDDGLAPGKPMHIYANWVEAIQKYCFKYFDQNALGEAVDQMDLKRVVKAKKYLLNALYPQKKCLLKDINEFKKQKGVAA